MTEDNPIVISLKDGKIPVVRRENNGGNRFATDVFNGDMSFDQSANIPNKKQQQPAHPPKKKETEEDRQEKLSNYEITLTEDEEDKNSQRNDDQQNDMRPQSRASHMSWSTPSQHKLFNKGID